jgi:hypothetical protein
VAEPRRSSQTVIKAPTGFRAQLPGLDLATLLQMACARGERAVVRVRSGGEEGFLFTSEGRLVHAHVGTLSGEQAVTRMLGWSAGDFALCDRPWPLKPSIDAGIEEVLIRAAQLRDESADHESEALVARLLPARPASSAPGRATPHSSNHQEGSVLASVRIDINGEIVAHHGATDVLAPLVGYVTRMGALLGPQLGLEPFEALSADLGERRALIYVEGREMVGLLLTSGPVYQELRQQLGV